MGKKKKKKPKKKKGGAKAKAGGQNKFENEGPPPMMSIPDDHVKLLVKLAHWSFMDFQMIVPTHTKLFVIKRKLGDKFGRMDNLKMYRNAMLPDNILTDDMSTLEENGFKGKPYPARKEKPDTPAPESKIGGAGDDAADAEKRDPSGAPEEKKVEDIPEEDLLPVYKIMFDFTPHEADAPLLLAESKHFAEDDVPEDSAGRSSPKSSPKAARKVV
jgi:hypothetical protein